MACGIPVIASHRGAIEEVTGGAALLLKDPKNVVEMLGAVRSVLWNRELRADLRAKGLQRVREFSWERSARKLLELYIDLGDKRRSGLPNG